MVNRLLNWERHITDLGRFKALGLGMLIGFLFALPTLLGFGGGVGWFAFGFLAYFPLHAWLAISLVLVTLSSFERERFLGRASYGFFSAFFARMFSAFGLFCLSLFYSLTVAAVKIGEIQ